MPLKLMRLKTQGQGTFMLRLTIIFTMIGNMAFAETWQKISNTEIQTALNGRTVKYAQAIQVFYADGRTLYEAQMPTNGKWRAENNQYCSVWPPAATWVCYDLERNSDGLKIRFIAKDGGIYEGEYGD